MTKYILCLHVSFFNHHLSVKIKENMKEKGEKKNIRKSPDLQKKGQLCIMCNLQVGRAGWAGDPLIVESIRYSCRSE